MARIVTILVTLMTAGLFAWAVPFVRLFDAFPPMITAISIMVAAVFVRLNRGMPTLEWKSVDPKERSLLTARIVSLTREYGWIIAIFATVLLSLVTLSVVGKSEVGLWPQWAQRLAAGGMGGASALCIARMAYVIWRDIDVVTLQKRLIDGSAVQEAIRKQEQQADDKIANIRLAGVRKVEVAPPKAWGE